MKCRHFVIAACALVLTGSLLAKPPSGGGFINPRYSMHVIDNEFGGVWSVCRKMNNDDDVIGAADVGLALEGTYGSAVLYVSRSEDRLAGTEMVAISDFLHPAERYSAASGNGWRIGSAVAINDSEQIVGAAAHFTDGVGTDRLYRLTLPPGIPSDPDNDLWGIMEDLQAPDLDPAGPGIGIVAIDQNNDGDVLCRAADSLILLTEEHGWQDGGTVVPGGAAEPRALSDRVDGALFLAGSSSAALAWRLSYSVGTGTFGAPTFFQSPYRQNPQSWAVDTNIAGQVAGEMRVSRTDILAHRVTGNTAVNLGTTTNSHDWNDSFSAAINDHGDIVGGALNGIGGNIHSFLSVAGNSGMTILSTLVDDVDGDPNGDTSILDGTVWIDGPADINDRRSICGPMTLDGGTETARAYLLTVKP